MSSLHRKVIPLSFAIYYFHRYFLYVESNRRRKKKSSKVCLHLGHVRRMLCALCKKKTFCCIVNAHGVCDISTGVESLLLLLVAKDENWHRKCIQTQMQMHSAEIDHIIILTILLCHSLRTISPYFFLVSCIFDFIFFYHYSLPGHFFPFLHFISSSSRFLQRKHSKVNISLWPSMLLAKI